LVWLYLADSSLRAFRGQFPLVFVVDERNLALG
jgi:hypothetical protein